MIWQITPAFNKLLAYIDIIAPYVVKMFALAQSVYKFTPINIIEAVYGLALCFFGNNTNRHKEIEAHKDKASMQAIDAHVFYHFTLSSPLVSDTIPSHPPPAFDLSDAQAAFSL